MSALLLSAALYTFTASADEITSVKGREVGLIESQGRRIAVKTLLLPGYLLVTDRAAKSPSKALRVAGKIVRFGLPAAFSLAAYHNLRIK